MKKFITTIICVAICLLTLSSCARTSCRAGSCPVWSDSSIKEFEKFDFRYIHSIHMNEEFLCVLNHDF